MLAQVRILFVWILFVHNFATGHLAAWHDGMYCRNGTGSSDDPNTSATVTPLFQLSKKDWWFHHVNGCDQFPPASGKYLELPAGGEFTIEIASNRGKTSLSFDGKFTSDWPDGKNYPDDYNVPSCITSPNMHTQNETMAAGTAFAISYQSDINAVTPENLVVFSIKYHTPWKRLTTYSVPAALPQCPDDGCHCAWGWIPNGCGEPNMYHQAFKCKVIGATSTTPVAAGKPPVWCEDDPNKCVKGAKQMIYWNQADGNNIEVSGLDLSGEPKSPAYNSKCGFVDGAQNDIFETDTQPLLAQPSSPSSAEPADASKTPSLNDNYVGDQATSFGVPSSPNVPVLPSSTPSPSPSTQCKRTRRRAASERRRISSW